MTTNGAADHGVTVLAPAAPELDAVSAPTLLVGEEWALLDALLATVVQVDALLNAVTAWRAELIDDVRRLGEQLHRARYGEPAPGTGRRSVVAELATALRVPERTMAAQVDEAQALVEHYPGALAAVRTGAVSYRHAEVLMDHTADLEEHDRAAAEAALLDLASRQTVSRFRASARCWRERHHPRAAAERHRAAADKRGVWVDPALDGMAYLSALLPAVQAHAIVDGVTGLATAMRGPDEPRTLAQLRADVLAALLLDPAAAALARDAAGSPMSAAPETEWFCDDAPVGAAVVPWWVLTRGIRAEVSVTVPFLTLLGRSDEPGQLVGYGPVDADTAWALAGQAAGWTRILTDPVSGEALDIGRDRYRVPGPMRRFLRQRDGTCRFPGCARAARRCDVDHTVAWEDGGGTSSGNLAHLCRAHHRLKHLAGWDVQQLAGGVMRWRSPVGRTYTTEAQWPVGDPAVAGVPVPQPA